TPQPVAPFLACPLAHDAEYDRTGTPARMDRIVQSMHWPLIIGLLSLASYHRALISGSARDAKRTRCHVSIGRARTTRHCRQNKKKPEYIVRFSLVRQSRRLSAATLSYNCTIPIVITGSAIIYVCASGDLSVQKAMQQY